MSVSEASEIDLEEFDCCIAIAWGFYGYRPPDGQWERRELRGSGLGADVSLPILDCIQGRTGVPQSRKAIAEHARNAGLKDDGVLASRMRVIRRALGDNGRTQRMIQTDPVGRYFWNPSLSWIWISCVGDEY